MCHLISFVLVPSEKGLQIFTENAMSRHHTIVEEQGLKPHDKYYEGEWPAGRDYPEVRVNNIVSDSIQQKLQDTVYDMAAGSRVRLFKLLAKQVEDPDELAYSSTICSEPELIKEYLKIFGATEKIISGTLRTDHFKSLMPVFEQAGWHPEDDSVNWLLKAVEYQQPLLYDYNYSKEEVIEALEYTIGCDNAETFIEVFLNSNLEKRELYDLLDTALKGRPATNIITYILGVVGLGPLRYTTIAKVLRAGFHSDKDLLSSTLARLKGLSLTSCYLATKGAVKLAIMQGDGPFMKMILEFAKSQELISVVDTVVLRNVSEQLTDLENVFEITKAFYDGVQNADQ